MTEETRRILYNLKEPGQTYDDLLRDLVQQRRREDLATRFREMDESRGKFVAITEV